MTVTWVFVVMLVSLVLSTPIAVAIGLANVVPVYVDPYFSGSVEFMLRQSWSGMDTITLLAIPLFMLSGAIMTHGGLAKRLFDVFAIIVGKVPGGMPSAVVITCLFYGAISGSGAATTAAVGAMCIPILIKLGYDKKFCGALVASAAGLGVIIPPSVPYIGYATMVNCSVTDLFTAGIVPGVLIAIALIAYTVVTCRKTEDKSKIADMNKELKSRGYFRVVREGFWALLTPIIILGGIYSGIVTPTEAACISVVYALIVCVFIYKTVNFKVLIKIFISANASWAPMGILFAFAMAFVKVLSLLQVPALVADFITSTFNNKIIFLLVVNVIFLLIGMIIDAGPAITVIAPLIITAATALGINDVHFGIILTTNLAIGFVTPPFGTNLFVAAPIADTPPIELGKRAIPMIGCLIICLLLITYIPQLSLMLIS